ncbi:GIN domain-containing protein [Phenylobacterium sp.]|jgi:hypothetical protein|uniref:GIN domain-containing protein n=1 Tax=Phenylobacterium sp. TaxID=1871053 RepID=UPI002F930615
MIRPLLMIAGAGFLLSVVTLSTAVAIGGPEALARGAWSDWNWDWDWDEHHGASNDQWSGEEATRELAWTGGESLEIDVPAEVTYTQGDGPARLVITGPARAVSRVELEDGRIGFRHGRSHSRGRLQIVMSAPNVTRFELNGADRLVINGYRQDRLTLELTGRSEVQANGETGQLALDISGAGEADLAALKTREARVEISGKGEARIAPTEAADLDISGAGEITLTTRPPRLDTDISGAGTIRQEGGAADTGADARPASVITPT